MPSGLRTRLAFRPSCLPCPCRPSACLPCPCPCPCPCAHPHAETTHGIGGQNAGSGSADAGSGVHQPFGRRQIVAAHVVATGGQQACQHQAGKCESTRHHIVPPRRSVGEVPQALPLRCVNVGVHVRVQGDRCRPLGESLLQSRFPLARELSRGPPRKSALSPRLRGLCELLFVRWVLVSLIKPAKPDHEENFAQLRDVH